MGNLEAGCKSGRVFPGPTSALRVEAVSCKRVCRHVVLFDCSAKMFRSVENVTVASACVC